MAALFSGEFRPFEGHRVDACQACIFTAACLEVLCGGAGLGVLPALRLLSTQVAHDQQAAATATVLAVAHGARAFGLALHAYVFEEATAHGTLNATFVLGLVAAFVALLVAVAIPPSPTAWRLSSAGSSGADVRDRDA